MNRENITKAGAETPDPRKRFASTPFPQSKQDAPGSSNDLQPHADYGESSYAGSGKLDGRAALITGADSGIGRAVALCFAKEGADILFAHLSEEEDDAKETVRLIEAAGRRGVAIPSLGFRVPCIGRRKLRDRRNLRCDRWQDAFLDHAGSRCRS
jgi:short chain dehydrogenase